ncbi:MAG TPA: hypothetical protein VK956_11740, partial [Verrucomicrobium sp.]|nr:hypothetical protein [Verrucomicrobium sp.]
MKTLRLLCAATTALAALAMTACQKEDTSYLNGYVEGDYVRVAAPFAGRLVKRPVMRGDEITPGSPLFTLNTDDELASRNEAAARVTAAEARLADLK